MKKIVAMLLAVAAAAALKAETECTVAAKVLNARQKPTVKSPVLMKLKEGAKITVIRRCGENWLEIALPPEAPVYVDEIFVVGGKAGRDLKMYAGKGRKFPVWGELKKGEEVKLEGDRAFGWVKIAPPERLRLYVVALYVDGADEVKFEEKPAEAKPEAKSEAKPEAKPETKAEAKPAEAKPEKKPEAKPDKKPAEAKPDTPNVKKPETELKPDAPDAALLELNVKKTAKGKVVKFSGTLRDSDGDFKAAKFLLLDDRGEYICFVYYPGKEAELKKLLDRKLTVQGTLFDVRGWKTPILQVRKLDKAK
jgi:uncharacterized protein YgiM (DUF1202 family)